MAKAKKGDAGAPAWIVTFADLMSLLVCFFVLIISFSIQDKEKLQIVAGSMRDAFGVQPDSRRSGFIEIEGEAAWAPAEWNDLWQRAIEPFAHFLQQRLQRLGLRDRAWETVQQKAGRAVVVAQSLLDHAIDQLVGHELAGVGVRTQLVGQR